jgi:hypothetical protein
VARGLPAYTDAALARKRKEDRGRKRNVYATRSAWVDDLKLGHGCTDCGYKVHPAALHFDHLPGSEKKDTIARMTLAASFSALQAEIAKCEVVCANCHAIRTANRRMNN